MGCEDLESFISQDSPPWIVFLQRCRRFENSIVGFAVGLGRAESRRCPPCVVIAVLDRYPYAERDLGTWLEACARLDGDAPLLLEALWRP